MRARRANGCYRQGEGQFEADATIGPASRSKRQSGVIRMFSWDFPYPSQRMPVLAKNVVATSQPLAAQAGLAMLARGGNAVDAGLAAAITLTVVEPTSNGIGSDGFALLLGGQRPLGPQTLRRP